MRHELNAETINASVYAFELLLTMLDRNIQQAAFKKEVGLGNVSSDLLALWANRELPNFNRRVSLSDHQSTFSITIH